MAEQTNTEQSDGLVFIDGRRERYRVLNYSATFTVRSEETGLTTTVSSGQLREMGIEWNGRELQPMGGTRS